MIHQAVTLKNAGFTLVEMLLVLTMVGVMAGSVVVSFEGRTQGRALAAAAEDLAATARFATAEARLTQRPHRLAFDGNMRRYWVEASASHEAQNS